MLKPAFFKIVMFVIYYLPNDRMYDHCAWLAKRSNMRSIWQMSCCQTLVPYFLIAIMSERLLMEGVHFDHCADLATHSPSLLSCALEEPLYRIIFS